MKLKLKVLQGASANQEIAVPVAKFLVGRGEECHLRPKSPAISRHHCAILTANGQVAVKDLGSKNGTFVNEQRIEGIQTVNSGDIVAFGPLTFEIVIDHTLGGVKRPKVRDIADVAERTQKESLAENDIASWLEEGNVTAEGGRMDDTSTRHFKVTNEMLASSQDDEDIDDSGDTTIMSVPALDETTADPTKKKKKKKKEYGKLPPRSDTNSDSSQDAASDAIKQYFNRG
ncbi:MAG: FHA domain-containing protein [Planctomycetaceae bacterium]|nr:FHA domain-containing protein [Planctomycetaceae bacterium]